MNQKPTLVPTNFDDPIPFPFNVTSTLGNVSAIESMVHDHIKYTAPPDLENVDIIFEGRHTSKETHDIFFDFIW